MLKFRQFLKEYLTPEQYQRYADIKMTKKSRSATDHFFGKGNDLVREELKNPIVEKSEPHKKIEQHLGRIITPEEYRAGKIPDKYGRLVRIGTQIKDPGLKKEYTEDNSRSGVKATSGHYVTVVRDKEVAGQTNPTPNAEHPSGHSWKKQSCKNIETGLNAKCLKDEIKHGTVVVRVHDHDGKEIYRATLQPHHNEAGSTAYALDSEYGVKHTSFTNHAHAVARRLSGDYKPGVFTIHPKVYNDSGFEFALHPSATSEHIDKALDDENPLVRQAAIHHPNATAAHIDKALEDKSYLVRQTAMRHSSVTSEHIDKALEDKTHLVRQAAIQHPNATSANIDKALDDKNVEVKKAAIQHPNATSANIDKALDKDLNVRRIAMLHPNATSANIDKALEDEEPLVRKAAIQHPNATSANIDKALRDRDFRIRHTAIQHPNATESHINKALEDNNQSVRWMAIQHPNATSEQIDKALEDKEPRVREVAEKLAQKN